MIKITIILLLCTVIASTFIYILYPNNKVCVKSHKEKCTRYINMPAEMNTNGVARFVLLPINGICTICDEYKRKNN